MRLEVFKEEIHTVAFWVMIPCSCGKGSIPGQVIWDLWWKKLHWGRCSPSTTVSPANSHYTNSSIFIKPIRNEFFLGDIQ
jgi:hypothetical protein